MHHPVRSVGAVGEDVFYEREELARGLEQRDRTVTILDRSTMSVEHEGTPIGVDEGMTLAALHLLAGIIASRAASLGRLYTWLSSTAADGLASRPTRSRSSTSS